MHLSFHDLKEFLDEKYHFYNRSEFIEADPISIPHRFTQKEDIEIAGFLTATISWGNRPAIIKNANRLMHYMDNDPFQFITQSTETDYDRFVNYVHRTFNGTDCIFFLKALKNIYLNHGGLETLFSEPVQRGKSIMESILYFRFVFFELPHPLRTEKHIANPAKNASAKRLNMYLRWMVRNDNGIDFGLWKSISPSLLLCPLDLHTGNVARKLGLLQRKSNDWKAVEELTANLRRLDPEDPVKYDISLFGLGIYEKF